VLHLSREYFAGSGEDDAEALRIGASRPAIGRGRLATNVLAHKKPLPGKVLLGR
jgi:hypothetical protein